MNVKATLEALRAVCPAIKVRRVPIDELYVTLPAHSLRAAVEVVVRQLGVHHLSTITGLDNGDEIELLYHFWDRGGLTLRVALPYDLASLPSLTDMIPGAAYYEREVSEMLGVTFEGHPDPAPLLLPDDWDGALPLRAEPTVAPPRNLTGFRKPVRFEPGSEPITIPIGPQHPLLKEPISFMLTAQGERIVDSALRLGYVHRGIERLCQERSYLQNLHLFERVCGICSHVHTTTYCQGVEALLGLEVPPRGLYLRTLLCELERVHSHLLWLGVLAENIGFTTIFMYAWRDREIALDVMEELSGGRVTHAVNVIGGVRIDIGEKQFHSIVTRLYDLEHQVEDLLDVILHERTFRGRTEGVGSLSPKEIRRYCAVGPVARASDVNVDLRRDAPYAAYDRMHVNVVTSHQGDVWARALVRTLETIESLRLCRQLLVRLPDGPTHVRAPRRVPPGEVVSRAEAPRGELIYAIRSDGTDRPARVKIRTPTLTALITLPDQLAGIATADISVVLSGVDLCIACADR